MAMTGSKDGETGSYPGIVDALTQHGAQASPMPMPFTGAWPSMC